MEKRSVLKGLIRCLASILILILLFSQTAYQGVFATKSNQHENKLEYGEQLQGGEKLLAKDGDFSLYINTDSGEIRIESSETGKVWRSNPENFRGDKRAKGEDRTRLGSQLLLTIADGKGKTSEINSLVESVGENGMKVFAATSGAVVQYNFPRLKVTVHVQYFLENGTLKVQIPIKNGIIDSVDSKIVKVGLLPYFSAAAMEQKGYILVPDGPGGIIRFNNGKHNFEKYNAPVYGEDKMVFNNFRKNDTRSVIMPVFGFYYQGNSKENDYGMFAEITRGEALASIIAGVAGRETSYNNAYASFITRPHDTATMLDRTWGSTSFLMTSKNLAECDTVEIKYHFLKSGECEYKDMAGIYRNTLMDKGMKQRVTGEYPMFIDAYMGVARKKNLAGWVYDGYEPMTTFRQAKTMLEELSQDGVESTVVQLKGIDSDGAYYGRIDTKIKVVKAIGGANGLKSFLKAAQALNSRVYPQVELVEFSKSGGGFNGFLHSAVSVTNKTIKRYEYRISNGERKFDTPSRYLLKPELVVKAANRLKTSLMSEKIDTLALDSLGKQPYSSYASKTNYSSNKTQEFMEGALKSLSDQSRLLLNEADGFAIPYAAEIASLPVNGSGYAIIDDMVPFVQMVIHGMIPYSSPALNLAGSPESQMLYAVECGAAPMFAFFYDDYEDVRETPLEFLYGACFKSARQEAAEIYGRMKRVFKGLENQKMIDHKILSDQLKAVIYENGSRILINYGDKPCKYEDTEIEGYSFVRIDRGGM